MSKWTENENAFNHDRTGVQTSKSKSPSLRSSDIGKRNCGCAKLCFSAANRNLPYVSPLCEYNLAALCEIDSQHLHVPLDARDQCMQAYILFSSSPTILVKKPECLNQYTLHIPRTSTPHLVQHQTPQPGSASQPHLPQEPKFSTLQSSDSLSMNLEQGLLPDKFAGFKIPYSGTMWDAELWSFFDTEGNVVGVLKWLI